MSHSRRRTVWKGMSILLALLAVGAILALVASPAIARKPPKPPKPEPPPEEAVYTVTDLGLGRAFAINDFGDVVGLSWSDSGDPYAAILALNSQPTLIDLGSSSLAYGINDLGQVVGFSTSPSEHLAPHWRAFVVTPVMVDGSLVWYLDEDPADGINDLMIDLNLLIGVCPGTESTALAINNLGQAVGWAEGRNENNELLWESAVLWQLDDAGNVLDWVALPGLDGAQSYNAYDINSDEDGDGLVQVVGSAYSSDGLMHAVLWEVDPEGNVSALVDLGYLSPEDTDGEATGINELGQVVGVSAPRLLYDRMFLVTPEDTDDDGVPDLWYADADEDGINDLMIALGPPEVLGGPEAINDSAQVVGYASAKKGRSVGVFLWENGVMTALNDLIPSEPKWSLSDAYSINEAGQIVGIGSTERETHGYLLTPTP